MSFSYYCFNMDDVPEVPVIDDKDFTMIYVVVVVILVLIIVLAIWFTYKNKVLHEKKDKDGKDEPKVVTMKDLREGADKNGQIQLTENDDAVAKGDEVYNFAEPKPATNDPNAKQNIDVIPDVEQQQ